MLSLKNLWKKFINFLSFEGIFQFLFYIAIITSIHILMLEVIAFILLGLYAMQPGDSLVLGQLESIILKLDENQSLRPIAAFMVILAAFYTLTKDFSITCNIRSLIDKLRDIIKLRILEALENDSTDNEDLSTDNSQEEDDLQAAVDVWEESDESESKELFSSAQQTSAANEINIRSRQRERRYNF